MIRDGSLIRAMNEMMQSKIKEQSNLLKQLLHGRWSLDLGKP